MELNRYLIAYFVFSVLGWIWESIYCTAKERKWQNRGFLYGPLCPIYGFGATIGLLFYDLISLGIVHQLSWWMIFIIGFFVSMILEYPTSYILEKKFHARWWDYSNVPLNLNGRTSVITSIGFGLGSIIIMKYLIPLYERAFAPIPDGIIIALSVVLVAIHSSDITLTVSRLTNFQSNIDEMEGMFQDKMTLTVDKLFERRSKLYGKTLSRIASFKMSESHNMIAERIIKAMHDSKRVK
ncbi:putative ABC transporter permease [Treponema sp. OMZ 305]|uniref:putative ABC transporter permease n=1 Tax=unclassified Treponema TaxID=2638727 RepID=UPI0020A2F5A4|nr:putative ABC transporter permease [Treponema sp. OMZ 305]UTC58864.1 putative ABC transporter permease [Treponema sp. OMZ 305]